MRILMIVLITMITSCMDKDSHTSSFTDIDYSYDNGWDKRFSIKIDSTGNINVKKDSICYQGIITESDLSKIDSLIVNLVDTIATNQFITYESDQVASKIDIIASGKSYVYLTYGDDYPKILSQIFSILQAFVNLGTLKTQKECSVIYRSSDILLNDTSIDKKIFTPPIKIESDYKLNWVNLKPKYVESVCQIFELIFENTLLVERLYLQKDYLSKIYIYDSTGIFKNCPDAKFRNTSVYFSSSNPIIDSLIVSEYRTSVKIDRTKDTIYIKSYKENLSSEIFSEVELRQRSGGNLIRITFSKFEDQFKIEELVMGKR